MRILQELYRQCNGEDGALILSELETSLSIEANVQVIGNPFTVDFNDRKVLHKLYQELKGVSEECVLDMLEIQQRIMQYLNALSVKVPYVLAYDERVDGPALYKMCNVRLENNFDDLQQKMIEYLKILSMLCGIKVVVFVNLKSFLDEAQLLELYKTAFYYKIYLLLIEATQRTVLKGEKYYILDQDDCFIEF